MLPISDETMSNENDDEDWGIITKSRKDKSKQRSEEENQE